MILAGAHLVTRLHKVVQLLGPTCKKSVMDPPIPLQLMPAWCNRAYAFSGAVVRTYVLPHPYSKDLYLWGVCRPDPRNSVPPMFTASLTPAERANAILDDSRRRSVAYAKRPSFLRGVDSHGHWTGKPLSTGRVRVSGGSVDDTMGILPSQVRAMSEFPSCPLPSPIPPGPVSSRAKSSRNHEWADPLDTRTPRQRRNAERMAARIARISGDTPAPRETPLPRPDHGSPHADPIPDPSNATALPGQIMRVTLTAKKGTPIVI